MYPHILHCTIHNSLNCNNKHSCSWVGAKGFEIQHNPFLSYFPSPRVCRKRSMDGLKSGKLEREREREREIYEYYGI